MKKQIFWIGLVVGFLSEAAYSQISGGSGEASAFVIQEAKKIGLVNSDRLRNRFKNISLVEKGSKDLPYTLLAGSQWQVGSTERTLGHEISVLGISLEVYAH